MTTADTRTPTPGGGGAAQLMLAPTAYDDAVAATLIEALQREFVVRYGSPDETPVDPAEFVPPLGLFLVGRLHRTPVACGGWRIVEPRLGELKRMFVTDAYRGRGLSRILLAGIEEAARSSGLTRLRLVTGDRQPEAVQLYLTSGYEPVEGFGHYRDAPAAMHLGKSLH